jgi:hypothetical protein
MNAKWFRSVNKDSGELGHYQAMTSKGRVIVNKDKVGELDLNDPKSSAILNKFVEANTGRTSADEETGKLSTFIGWESTRVYSKGEAKFAINHIMASDEAGVVECSYTEV